MYAGSTSPLLRPSSPWKLDLPSRHFLPEVVTMETLHTGFLYDEDVVRGTTYIHRFEKVLYRFDIVILTTSLISNFGMIYFICGQKRSRTAHNISIVSIAVADILNASVTIPMGLMMFLFRFEDDEITPFLCKMNKYVGFWSKTVMIYSTLGMVISRYFRITDPRSHVFEAGRCMFYLNFVWFSGAAYNIWKVMLNTTRVVTVVPTEDGDNMSTIKWCTTSDYFHQLHAISACADFVVIFFLPSVIVFFLSARIITFQWRNYGRLAATPSSSKSCRLATCFMYSSIFLGLQLPQEILNSSLLYRRSLSDVTVGSIRVCETLSYLQCLCNVFAYCVTSEEFHKAFCLCVCNARVARIMSRRRGPRPSSHGLLQSKAFDEQRESISLT